MVLASRNRLAMSILALPLSQLARTGFRLSNSRSGSQAVRRLARHWLDKRHSFGNVLLLAGGYRSVSNGHPGIRGPGIIPVLSEKGHRIAGFLDARTGGRVVGQFSNNV